MSQFCQNCYHKNLDIAIYCSHCGNALLVKTAIKKKIKIIIWMAVALLTLFFITTNIVNKNKNIDKQNQYIQDIVPKPVVKPKPLPLKNSVTPLNGLLYQNQPFTKDYTWQEAKEYCQGLTLDGYKDWRLPNRKELNAIKTSYKVQGQENEYYILPEFVQNLRYSDFFWTSKSKNSSYAWIVIFGDLHRKGWQNKTYHNSTLCVCKPPFLKNSVTINGLAYENQPFIKEYSRPEAKKYCQGLTLDGYNNWRLPTRKELKSIMTKNKIQGQKKKYYIRPEFIQNLRDWGHFWTFDTKDSLSSWIVNFHSGGESQSIFPNYALCVRNIKDIVPKPIVKPKPLPLKNSVTINGLTYQNQPFIKEYTWQEAKKYCQGLTLNGYRNWRLPNKEELKSIMTKNKIQGHQKRKYYIRPEFVQNLRGSAWFRTSTENSSSTWGVYFYGGYDGWLDKEGNDYALCVHDTKDIIPKPLPSKHKEKTPKPTPITTISI